MENYSYGSYADSGDSSPRSREIEFDSVPPPPWDAQNYRPKFMCSYGGKILPRPHDNSLCYVGGETKILAVDRPIKLSTLAAKLSALFAAAADVSFKYQLPGEDLDALISVTSDEDLELMMCEHDRLFRAGARSAKMRLFLFPAYGMTRPGFSAPEGLRPDRDIFVEALNLGPIPLEASAKRQNAVDFLLGLEKYGPPSAPPAPDVVHAPPQPSSVRAVQGGVENYAGMFPGDNYYTAVVAAAAAAAAAQKFAPPERHVMASGGFPAAVVQEHPPPQQQHPVYMVPSSGAMLHPPYVRPVVSAAVSQAAMTAAAQIYREKQVYGMVSAPPQPTLIHPPFSAAPPATHPPFSAAMLQNIPPQSSSPVSPAAVPPYSVSTPPAVVPPPATKVTSPLATAAYPVSGGFVVTSEAAPYGHVAYSGTTPRHVYYAAAPGGRVMMAPPQHPPTVPALPQSFAPAAAMARGVGGVGLESKAVLAKIPQGRV